MLHRNQRFGFAVRFIAAVIACLWFMANCTVAVAGALIEPNNVMLGAKQDLSFVEEIEQPEQTKQLIDEPVLFQELDYEIFYDTVKSKDFIVEINSKIQCLETSIESDEYTIEAVDSMLQEKSRLLDIITQIESDVSHYIKWEQEYYYAAKTWQFLKQQGFSDVVVSGIMGNLMVETGGQTLKLVPTLYDAATGQYYGICQWSLKYRPTVAGMPFEDQLYYLMSDIEYEMDTFGFCYKSGFTYKDFIELDSPEAAALAFAKAYERCSSRYYRIREKAAIEAFNYFDLNNTTVE